MKYIYFIALLLGGSFCFAEDEDPLTQLELMNTLTRQEIQLEQMKLEAEIHDRLNEIDMQNAAILTRLQVRDSDMGNYIDALSWVSGVVIGFVGILFGIGAFILYRENQDVATRTREQLDAWNEQTANLQSTFDDWFVNAKKEYTGELDLLSRIMRLRIILDQESPTAEEIYPEISPLYSKPKLEYLPIFRKIMSLEVGEDIKRHTQAAIDQIRANQQAQ
jgi:hypothetical protein